MELTEIPDTYYFERKQILAKRGLTGGYQLFGKKEIWADGTYCFERTHILKWN